MNRFEGVFIIGLNTLGDDWFTSIVCGSNNLWSEICDLFTIYLFEISNVGVWFLECFKLIIAD